MPTAVEQLGALHQNYAGFGTSSGTPTNFEDCLVWNLMNLENASLVNNGANSVLIHDVAGNPTLGYGLDIRAYSANWIDIRNLIVFALDGENNLTQTQRDGLDLLGQWKNGPTNLSAANFRPWPGIPALRGQTVHGPPRKPRPSPAFN